MNERPTKRRRKLTETQRQRLHQQHRAAQPSTVKVVSRDVWTRILSLGLSVRDLLAVRTTCHYLNDVVKSMQMYWYRQYWYYLAKYFSARPNPFVARVHLAGYYNPYSCIRDAPRFRMLPYSERRMAVMCALRAGEVTQQNDCSNTSHFRKIIPKTAEDIPIDERFTTRGNPYIYRYLILVHRYHAERHRKKLDSLDREVISADIRVQKCRRDLAYAESMHRQACDELAAEKEKYPHHIFDGVRITSYRGV